MIVIDACGAGALPDAGRYGDEGTNTLAHVAALAGGLELPVLQRLGLGNVMPIEGVAPVERPVVHGRLAPLGSGKDSTAGHWELMGIPAPVLPVYLDGFPAELIGEFAQLTGRGVICNARAEGLGAIAAFGEEHMRTGDLIVYTSQDSVFQVAAHTSVVSEEELYDYCRIARRMLDVGRVIARPFDGDPGAFRRTSGRHDFAIAPPARSYLDELCEDGMEVHAVGKVADIFLERGITRVHPGHDNRTALDSVGRLMDDAGRGLVFANLVDTDQVHGHRKDVAGFAAALAEIDTAVGEWLERMGPGDLLCICADHGCDPAHPGTDHTREYSPLLATFAGQDGRRVDAAMACVGASALRWISGHDADLPGEPFTPALVSSG